MPENKNGGIFKDAWAIILGGSSGFGLAAIRKLASEGMNIVVAYRETAAATRQLQEECTHLQNEYKIKILPFNINALDGVVRDDCIRQLSTGIGKGSVKMLLHSIARGNLKPLISEDLIATNSRELSMEDLAVTSYAMCHSLLDWTREVFKAGLFCADARVIGLTSEGATSWWKSYAAVSIAKASLQSLITYMAVEFGKYGVKANLIQAGITETPSLKKIAGSEELLHYAASTNPLGRSTTTGDVANVIFLLCTKEAYWINGALLHVDGGEHCL